MAGGRKRDSREPVFTVEDRKLISVASIESFMYRLVVDDALEVLVRLLLNSLRLAGS